MEWRLSGKAEETHSASATWSTTSLTRSQPGLNPRLADVSELNRVCQVAEYKLLHTTAGNLAGYELLVS